MRPDLSKITSAKIRSFLRRHPYRRYGYVPEHIELLFLETIPQAEVFFLLCEELSRPPTQEELVKRYLDLCKDEISEKHVNPEHVSNRIARAWGTYVGELDFYCQVRDSGLFEQVIYDTKFNYELGYDLVVDYKGRTFYIHLYYYYETRKAWAERWLATRDRRHGKARARRGLPEPIDFPLTDKDADVVGNLHLYKARHVQKLKQILEGQL